MSDRPLFKTYLKTTFIYIYGKTMTSTPITFRIDLECLPKGINVPDLIQDMKSTDQFLVLHKKLNNYHYHGYFKTTLSTRTIRRRLKDILNSPGNAGYSVSDKVPECDKYKAYCLFSKEDTTERIIVNEDLEKLRALHLKRVGTPNKTPNDSKIENYLKKLKPQITPYMPIKEIISLIANSYMKDNMVLHKANITQMTYTLHAYSHKSTEVFAEGLISSDDGISNCHQADLRRVRDNTCRVTGLCKDRVRPAETLSVGSEADYISEGDESLPEVG